MSREGGTFQTLQPMRGGPGDHGERGASESSRIEEGPPPLKPREAGEILDLSMEVFAQRFALYAGISALMWLPVRALQGLFGLAALGEAKDPGVAVALLGGLAVSTALAAVVQALTTAFVALLVNASLQGRSLAPASALITALRRVLGVLGIAIVTGIGTFVGYVMCCAPGVYLQWKLALAPSVYVLEGGGFGASISRSFAITNGTFLRWLAIIAVLLCMTLPLTMVGGVGDHPLTRAWLLDRLPVSVTVFDVCLALFSSIFNGVATALMGVVMTVLYLDCRVRRDGQDLRLELERMQRDLAPPAQP